MCLITLLLLPLALCDVRFPDPSTNTIVILIVFCASASVVLVPCMLGVYLIKRAIDKERAELLSADSFSQLPNASKNESTHRSYDLIPDMKDQVIFKNWFSLFERRVRSS